MYTFIFIRAKLNNGTLSRYVDYDAKHCVVTDINNSLRPDRNTPHGTPVPPCA